MSGPAYPAARIVADRLHEQFARRVASEGPLALGDGILPHGDDIEGIIDAAFWASLRRQEGYLPRISLAYVRPEQTRAPVMFERPLPLAAAALARLAPAVERPGIHLGVWRDGGRLWVWGTTRAIPLYSFVLEVVGPGLLVVKHRRSESGKFTNVVVLDGDDVKLVDERASSLPDCPPLLSSLLGFNTPGSWREGLNVLVELAVSMRAHGRGGSLLVVPAASDAWRESIVHPIPYRVSPSFAELHELLRATDDGRRERVWRDALDRTIDAVAGLTAVDGATIITDEYDLLAFGAKIGRRDGWPQVNEVVVTEPIEGAEAAILEPSQLGGTRHLSAAQFVRDQRDAVALVASQDGRFTVFAWSPCEEMVHAHRVESLLL